MIFKMHRQSHTFSYQTCVMLNLLLVSFYFSKVRSVTNHSDVCYLWSIYETVSREIFFCLTLFVLI